MLDESKLQKGELKAIAKVLTKMQEDKRDGLGLPCIQILVTHLRKGRVNESIEYVRSLSEDLWSYPEIRRFIHDVIYPIGYLDHESGLFINDKE